MMRRVLSWLVAMLLLPMAASLMALATPLRLAHVTAATSTAVVRLTERAIETALANRGEARLCLVRALDHVAEPALADEVLQFKPISPESASRLDARSRRTRVVTRTVPAPDPPRPTSDTLVRIPDEATSPATPIPPSRRAGEMMRIGSDIHVEKDQVVEGDVVAISGDVHVDGHVKGSVQSLGGDVYLSSTARVDGDVAAVKGELHEEPGAYVGGQRVTALGRHSSRLMRHKLMEADELIAKPLREMWRFMRTLAWLLVMLGIVWLVLRIAPARTEVAVSLLKRETAASLGIGLLMWVLLVPSIIALCLVVAILCITIIGIPVAIAALLGYILLIFVVLFWGFIVGATWLGSQTGGRPFTIPPGGATTLRYALIGTTAVIGLRALGHLIGMIPFFGFLGGFLVVVGWILSWTVGTLGAGALLRSEFASGHLGRWWRGRSAHHPVVPTPAPAAAPGIVPANMPPIASAPSPAVPPSEPTTFAGPHGGTPSPPSSPSPPTPPAPPTEPPNPPMPQGPPPDSGSPSGV